MVIKISMAILGSILLASCISVVQDSDIPIPQQNFVTAALAPTKVQLLPAPLMVTPEQSLASTLIQTPPIVNCTDVAILLRDVTVQDDTQINPGEVFIKTWEFQNTGTCPWTGYTVKLLEGRSLNAPLSAPVPDTSPNGKAEVSIELTAPTADGKYAAYFSLVNARGESILIGTQKNFWVRIVVGESVAIPAAPGGLSRPSGNCLYGPNGIIVNEIISLINSARLEVGLNTLVVDPQLAAYAQFHSEDMAYNNFLSHDGSDGTFSERLVNSPYGMMSEILAIGTPHNAMDQWHRDEHWDFVTNPYVNQFGVGYAYNSCSDYGGYITVDFH